jgi:D-alanine-D-alanine ligase
MRILLVTGPAGEAQGWGNFETTLRLRDVLESVGVAPSVFFAESAGMLIERLQTRDFDMVWSALYYISNNSDFIGLNSSGLWVHDILEQMSIPHVGSGAQAMKWMLDKARTNAVLAENGIAVPWQYTVEPGDEIPDVEFPAFVKPRFESRSIGVSEGSVILSRPALRDRIAYVHREFAQAAIVEEYLPGREFTVAVIGNSAGRGCYSVENIIDPSAYTRFPVITWNHKHGGWLDLRVPYSEVDRLHAQAAAAASALGCTDHVRLDVREDRNGRVKVLEVNGIPALNPAVSRSLAIYRLYHHLLTPAEAFRLLVQRTVLSAAVRHRLVSEGRFLDRRRVRVDSPVPRLS